MKEEPKMIVCPECGDKRKGKRFGKVIYYNGFNYSWNYCQTCHGKGEIEEEEG